MLTRHLALQRHTLAQQAVERSTSLFVTLGNLHFYKSGSCPSELQVGAYALQTTETSTYEPALGVLVSWHQLERPMI